MNSESEKKLSMGELMALNRPAQPASEVKAHPIVIQCTLSEMPKQLENRLERLEKLSSQQVEYLNRLWEMRNEYPTRTQMDELLKATRHLEQMSEQAGKQKEKRFSLPSIRLRLPHLDGPTVVVLLMTAAALLLLWWGLDTVWNGLSLLNL